MADVPITMVNSSGNIDPGYEAYLIDASSNNITLTMLNITSDGFYFMFKRVDNSLNTVTIQGYSISQTIDGNSAITLNSGDKINLVAFNSVWWSI